MSTTTAKSYHTIYLYTEEQRGKQLVESIVLGTITDISSSDKLVVVQDPHSGLKFVYSVHFDSNNLDAVGITNLDEEQFDGKTRTAISDSIYRLGTPEQALTYLRKRTHWIQDKGAVLSVLLNYAAARRHNISAPRSITRTRMVEIPAGVPVESLEAALSAKVAAEAAMAIAKKTGIHLADPDAPQAPFSNPDALAQPEPVEQAAPPPTATSGESA